VIDLMRRTVIPTLASLIVAVLLLSPLTQARTSAAGDQAITNGWFFTQTGGGSGKGYAVTDDAAVPYWTFFQEAGGVQALGYPISHRWTEPPFTYQAFQKAILQWNGQGMFYANTYDRLSELGKDRWLDAFRLTTPPQAFPEDAGQPFEVVTQNHLRLLEENPAIQAKWYENTNWLNAYGLPVAYQDRGDVRVLRAQRAVFQQWMVATAWAARGEVVVSNGGDVYKEAGLIPAGATVSTPNTSAMPSATPITTSSPSPTPDPTATPTATPAPSASTPNAAPVPTAQPGSIELPPSAAIPLNVPTYSRSDWRHWTDDDRDCQNTRHEVLIVESLVPVSFKTTKSCQVATGQWWAAFTDVTVTNASQLDVDHLVPLKNAHLSGGWAWDAATKRRYANILTDAAHLIAVTASANRSKGAKGPDQWKPPNTAYWCTYATDWVGVKITWGLTVTSAEAAALTEMLGTCGTAVSITQASTPAPTTPSPAPALTPSATPAPTPMPPPQPTSTPTSEPTPTATLTSEPSPAAVFEIVALDCPGKPESITIRNTGSQSASLGGWAIHDEGQKHTYVFAADAFLTAGADVNVWSWTGAASKSLFWTGSPVWNNTGDTASLLNPSGTVVSQRACT
jgi:hypothetical protein